jgi:aspartate aminotransferase
VEVARRHELLIVSDEIYEPFLYDGASGGLPSPMPVYERTLLLRGFSKSHAMTGWRLGYAAGPEEIVGAMAKLQQYTFVCAPAPFQWGAVAALDVAMDGAVADYRKKRDVVVEALKGDFEIVKPEGAFYVFPKAPAGMSGSELAARAVEKNVLVIPGNVFSERDTHFRISYATTEAKLREGCAVLCKLAKEA